MSNSKSNLPSSQVNDLEPDLVAETVKSLLELNHLGKPETDTEVKNRVNQYFQFCQDTGTRPGIETLCLSLHISRTTLFNWSSGIGCSAERQEIIEKAKTFIAAFLEQIVLRGRISPPSGIFLMKAWLGYRDTISFEDINKKNPVLDKPRESLEQIKEEFGGLLLNSDQQY
ncbi:hypothetical protein [Blautia sp.]|jgi:hypothetical protein|uniref:hypothetical protein n=1 Tax=Blautia sp. TaxID=1955243 RepID=UPI002583161E|nr:hypothetical protein [Blautia sp.]